MANAGCFGCGEANSIGMKLHFERHPEGGVQARFLPQQPHQGYDGIMHGGLVAVLLDEAMAWAASEKTVKYVTAKMELKYRLPVLLGKPVNLRGWLMRDRGRLLEVRAEVRSDQDETLAESAAVFVRAPEAASPR